VAEIQNRLARWAPATAIAGGLLWIGYAVLAMLEPMGEIGLGRDAAGQWVVANVTAFRVTSLVGAAALLLLGATLVGLARRNGLPLQTPGRFGVAMGWVGVLAAMAAVLAALPPLAGPTLAALNFASLLVAFGTLLVAVDGAGQPATAGLGSALFLVGALGMVGLLIQAAAALWFWVLPVYAALAMAVYGFAWVRLGNMIYRQGAAPD
jgi:hypothetical protein